MAVNFGEPVPTDGVRVISTHWNPGNARLEVDLQQPNGTWTPAPTSVQEHGPLDLRASAMRYVKRLGFTHVVGLAGKEGTGLLVHALADKAPEWSLEVVAEADGFYVLRVR